MALDKDFTREIVEAAVALLRPIMQEVRDSITTGPSNRPATKEEIEQRRLTAEPEDLIG